MQKFQTQTTLTKDIWKIAKDQIDKIPIQNRIVVSNPQQSIVNKKSIDDVFSNASQTLNKIMPAGQKTIKQTSKNVPSSVKLLDRYAQKLGFLPMGQIYQGMGNKYIGRVQKKTNDGQVFYKQFPDLSTNYIDSPDLTQNLTFYANKAITRWNDFVSAQSDLANFLKKAESQEGRKQLTMQYAKTASQGSDKLRILSSLYHYYVDEKSPNSNILELEISDIQILQQTLKRNQQLKDAYTQIITFIDKKGSPKLVNLIKNYHDFKKQTIRASVRQQQFQEIQKMIDDETAYIPDQMIAIPVRDNSKWLRIVQSQSNKWTSRMITTQWNPNAQWFRPINYLKF